MTAATYAAFGRTPLSLHWTRLAASYFSRVAALPDDRPVKRAFLAAQQPEQHLRQSCRTGLGALQQHLTSTAGLAASTPDDLAALKRPRCAAATAQHWAAQWYRNLRCSHCPAPKEHVAHFLFRCPLYTTLRTHFTDLFPPSISTPQAWLAQPAWPAPHSTSPNAMNSTPPCPVPQDLCWLPVDFKCN